MGCHTFANTSIITPAADNASPTVRRSQLNANLHETVRRYIQKVNIYDIYRLYSMFSV